MQSAGPLGEKSKYEDQYNPRLLFPIPRQSKRLEIGIVGSLPFRGFDIWNAYEISWLNKKGKPFVALGELIVPCESLFLIESKSLKLYFNSFNNSIFDSVSKVQSIVEKDLSAAAGAPVRVKITEISSIKLEIESTTFSKSNGTCLDSLDIECTEYTPQPSLLFCEPNAHNTEEILYSELLKSNCLVTGQPDWGSVQMRYRGKQINHEGLLRYIVSFRNHNEFHEQCVERIFEDIRKQCSPDFLSVYARYTRRGGLDINPFRSNFPTEEFISNKRLYRQ